MSTAHLTIDLSAIVHNWHALNSLSDGTVETGVTVKANAYSLGAKTVSRTLAKAGAQTFFVAAAEEGAIVRKAVGDKRRIFVYSGHMSGDTDLIRDLGLIPLLNSIEQITRHIEALPAHPFGIQLDTGMNRLGLEPEEWTACRDLVLKQRPELVMSHLACGDEPNHPMNQEQLSQFLAMTEGIEVPRSLSATAGILLDESFHFDIVRPGIGLYGGLPFEDAQPVVRLATPLIQTRIVQPGESVGYGTGWVADAPTKVATVATGYADGILRSASNQAVLFDDETPCPLIGRVSMDMIAVDVTHLQEVPKVLDILCPSQTIDDLAESAGTIGHEVLTALGDRPLRRYKGGV